MMSASLDPANASIDELIAWIRARRRQYPTTSLAQWLDVDSLPIQRLTDIACIDLIECRRLRLDVQVESLLAAMPRLSHDQTAILDLIDADVCSLREAGLPVDVEAYCRRFASYASSIRTLVQLTPVSSGHISTDYRPAASGHFRFSPAVPSSPSLSSQCLAEGLSREESSTVAIPSDGGLDIAVHPPSWFTREQVQASSEQSCLIRGRDSQRNVAVAMKVIHLVHAQINREGEAWLADIEATSRVKHPAWVGPDIAAIEDSTLAVIRPWIFGMRWDQSRQGATVSVRLRDLARVGYALQSAHDTHGPRGHAAHGGLHLNNLIVDADGQVRIMDAASSVQPAAYDAMRSGEVYTAFADASPAVHRCSDVRSLGVLAKGVLAKWRLSCVTDSSSQKHAASLENLCETWIESPDRPNACAHLADAMLRFADGHAEQSPSRSAHHHDPARPMSFWRRLLHLGPPLNDHA